MAAHTLKALPLALLVALLSSSASAQTLGVGDEPADITPRIWLHPPVFESFSELAGDVVVIKSWGKDSVPSIREMAAVNKLHETPGVHVVSLYDQVHELKEISTLISEHKITYPIAFDSFREAGYVTNSLPHVWIVGTEGKIIFSGGTGYDELLAKEIAKVKYPGLGRHSFHKSLEPAAKAYAAGKYADAYKLAEAVYDETSDEEVEHDADYIMKHIDNRLSTLVVRAETAEILKDFKLAKECWRAMAKHYTGMDDASDAQKRLDALDMRREVQIEITARNELLRLILSLDVDFQTVDDNDPAAVLAYRRKCLAAFQKFAKDNENTAAADIAEDLVKTISAFIPEE